MSATPAQVGLRERKKQRTRQAISTAAVRLFAERGFEEVTVAEIAEAAEVSPKTVFNYFPRKEDLVYERQAAVEESLLAALRDRARGESVVDGMRRYLVDIFSGLSAKDAPELMGARARIVGASPALQAREREIFAELTRALAGLLAEQAGKESDDPQAYVVANALMGVNRALLDSARRKVLAGRRGKRLVDEVLAEMEEALGLLERGFRDYARKRR
jgi:AcrR family transcriptional regulator